MQVFYKIFPFIIDIYLLRMVMSRYQNAGRNHSVRIDNGTFEMVEEFKYLGTTLTKPKFYSGRN